MWGIVGILGTAAIIGFIEIPSLVKRKLKKELCFFSFLLLLGAGLSIAKSLRLPIPNPLDWIAFMFKPMSDALSSLLK